MKKFIQIIFIFTTLLYAGCTKDHVISSDYYFTDLSKGNGLWKMESLKETIFYADGSSDTLQTPPIDELYWVFYIRTEEVTGTTLDENVLAIFEGGGTNFRVWGEYVIDQAIPDRFTIIYDYNPLIYYDYTIEEHSKTTLKLNRIIWKGKNYTVKKYVFSKCDECEINYGTRYTNYGG